MERGQIAKAMESGLAWGKRGRATDLVSCGDRRHCDRSDSVCLPNQVGGLLSDHDAGRHSVPSRDARHDRGVSDAQAVDAVYAELTVNDGHFITAHFGRAGLMPEGGYCFSHEALELARCLIARHNLTFREPAHDA